MTFKFLSQHKNYMIMALILCALPTPSIAYDKREIFNRSTPRAEEPKSKTAQPTSAENPAPKPAATYEKNSDEYKGAMTHVRNLSTKCKGKWQTSGCIKTLSGVSFVMVSNYAHDLQTANRNNEVETLKQYCAASTAALQIKVQAPAMRSAMTECINKISDLNDQTGLRPDPNYAQMIVSSILCLDKSPMCFLIEQQLGALSRQ